MLRFSVIASLLLIAAVMIKSNFESDHDQAKPMKLSGFSISKPKSRIQDDSKSIAFKHKARRSISGVKPIAITPINPKQVATKTPIQALAPEQKIARAKQAWENIRVKALNRLRVDQNTRDRIDELREDYYKSTDPLKYSDYEQNLRDLLGEQNYTFLWNARERFKSHVFERAQIEIGPHLGEL